MILAASIAVLLGGALIAAVTAAIPKISAVVSVTSLVAGCLTGFAAVIARAWAGEGGGVSNLAATWALPSAHLFLLIDGLSAVFLLTVLGICLLTGIYGEAYLRRSPELSASKSLRPLFLLLTASLAVVVCASNAILFLFAWELMALASFFLVIIEDKHPEVRRAGLLYFICTHTATLALFVLFSILGRAGGSLDFPAIRAAVPPEVGGSVLVLVLALVAFGMKAGIMPFHVWLQEAHPAAPSHVSAVMSGVVIKIGIYGLLRLIWLLRSVPEYWAVVLVLVGAISGVGGVVFALAQHDLKRLLAYHSVENIGIIALGMGLGCLGLSRHQPVVALLGFSGAVLHTINHALFKSLLFLSSGSFYQSLGTRDIEAGGGLLKTMPWTSTLSLIGAAAISGVPPLNGFVSEWLVYLAAMAALAAADPRPAVASIAALALIGGLALACFTKAYGTLCLGVARTAAARGARDPGPAMILPMAALAAVCGLIGLWPGPFVGLAGRAAAVICDVPPESARLALAGSVAGARIIGLVGACVIAAGGLLVLLRSFLQPGLVSMGATWGCGFTRPTARIQYTASSFAQPLTRGFAPVLGVWTFAKLPTGYWPAESSFSTRTEDPILDGMLSPLGAGVVGALSWLKRRQRSRLQYYMLYVALFLIGLFFWKL